MTTHTSSAPRADNAARGHCATCAAPATYLITARGSGPITYRATLACAQHRGAERAWAARAGPAVTEALISNEQEPSTLF